MKEEIQNLGEDNAQAAVTVGENLKLKQQQDETIAENIKLKEQLDEANNEKSQLKLALAFFKNSEKIQENRILE